MPDDGELSTDMVVVPATDNSTNVATTTTSRSIIDSLPYVDYFPEDYEAYALSLIEEEMKSLPPPDTKRRLGHLTYNPEPHLPPLTKLEYENLVSRNGQPRPPSDRVKLETQPPRPPTGALAKEDHAWKASIRSAKIDLERQRSRMVNLELQQNFETGQWKLHVALLDDQAKAMEETVGMQRMVVDRINAERKSAQDKAAPKLHGLVRKWDELVTKNERLAKATDLLQVEVKRLRKEKSDTNGEGVDDRIGQDKGDAMEA
eukprot:CAMPEP_0195528538 /NCGR_PEP_ID=MMETSP0794_2-20130614/30719_1 /TAXON_ID=515487 /ORGANISM="Stephanopyxis turris, Strain CCMP 815" /LENGTH=259 /DNA_ID=CAMNT_0040659693 /DNA_START=93 /DNA_END=872 /DNA_ORIENTATION=+